MRGAFHVALLLALTVAIAACPKRKQREPKPAPDPWAENTKSPPTTNALPAYQKHLDARPAWASKHLAPLHQGLLRDLFEAAAPVAEGGYDNVGLVCHMTAKAWEHTKGTFDTLPDLVARFFLGDHRRETVFAGNNGTNGYVALPRVSLNPDERVKVHLWDLDNGGEREWDYIGANAGRFEGGELALQSERLAVVCRPIRAEDVLPKVRPELAELYWEVVYTALSGKAEERATSRRERTLWEAGSLLGWDHPDVVAAVNWPSDHKLLLNARPEGDASIAAVPLEAAEANRMYVAASEAGKGELDDGVMVCRLDVTGSTRDGGEVADVGADVIVGPVDGHFWKRFPSDQEVVTFAVNGVTVKHGAKVLIDVWDLDAFGRDALGIVSATFQGQWPFRGEAHGMTLECRRPPPELAGPLKPAEARAPAVEYPALSHAPALGRKDPLVKLLRRRDKPQPLTEEALSAAKHVACQTRNVTGNMRSFTLSARFAEQLFKTHQKVDHFRVTLGGMPTAPKVELEASARVPSSVHLPFLGRMATGTKTRSLGSVAGEWTTSPQRWKTPHISLKCVLVPEDVEAALVEKRKAYVKAASGRMAKAIRKKKLHQLDGWFGPERTALAQVADWPGVGPADLAAVDGLRTAAVKKAVAKLKPTVRSKRFRLVISAERPVCNVSWCELTVRATNEGKRPHDVELEDVALLWSTQVDASGAWTRDRARHFAPSKPNDWVVRYQTVEGEEPLAMLLRLKKFKGKKAGPWLAVLVPQP